MGDKRVLETLNWPVGTDIDAVQKSLTDYLTTGNVDEFVKSTDITVIRTLVASKTGNKDSFGNVSSTPDIDNKAYLLCLKALDRYKARLYVYRLLALAMTNQTDISGVDARFNALKKLVDTADNDKKTPQQVAAEELARKSQEAAQLRDASAVLAQRSAADAKARADKAAADLSGLADASKKLLASLMGQAKVEEDERRAAIDRARNAAAMAVKAQVSVQALFEGVVNVEEYEKKIAEILNDETTTHASADVKYREGLIEVNATLRGLIYIAEVIASKSETGKKAMESQITAMSALGRLTEKDLEDTTKDNKVDQMVKLFALVPATYEALRKRKLVLDTAVINYSLLISEKRPDSYKAVTDGYKKLFDLEAIEKNLGSTSTNLDTFREMENAVRRNLLGERYGVADLEKKLVELKKIYQSLSYSYYRDEVRSHVDPVQLQYDEQTLDNALNGLSKPSNSAELRLVLDYLKSESEKINDLLNANAKAEVILARFRNYSVLHSLWLKALKPMSIVLPADGSVNALTAEEKVKAITAIDNAKAAVEAQANLLLQKRSFSVSRPGNLYMTESESRYYSVYVKENADRALAIVAEVTAMPSAAWGTATNTAIVLTRLNAASLYTKVALMRLEDLDRAVVEAAGAPANVPPPLDPGYMLRVERIHDVDLTALVSLAGVTDYRAEWSATAARSKAAMSGVSGAVNENLNDNARRNAVYIHQLYTMPGSLGVKVTINKVHKQKKKNPQLDTQEFDRLAAILTKCNDTVKYAGSVKPFDAIGLNKEDRERVAKYQQAYNDWTSAYPRFVQLGVAFNRTGLKNLPAPDIRLVMRDSLANIERIRKDLQAQARGFKTNGEELAMGLKGVLMGLAKPTQVAPPPVTQRTGPIPAIPMPLPLPLVPVLTEAETAMAQDLVIQAEAEVVAQKSTLDEEVTAMENDMKSDPELAESILNRMGTRWVPLEVDIAKLDSSVSGVAKYLFELMPKLASGFDCIAWAIALLRASDTEGVTTIKKKAAKVRAVHKKLFPSRTDVTTAKASAIDDVVSSVVEWYTLYKLWFDRIVGSLRRRISTRFYTAARLIADSVQPAQVFRRIFKKGSEIRVLFGKNADDIIKLLTENVTAFQVVIDPEEVNTLRSLYLNISGDLKTLSPLPTDFSTSTVKEVVESLSTLSDRIAATQVAIDASNTFDLNAARDIVYTKEAQTYEKGDLDELEEFLNTAIEPLNDVDEELFPVAKEIKFDAESLELEIAAVGSNPDAAKRTQLAKEVANQVARARHVKDMADDVVARGGDLKEDLWLESLNLTSEEVNHWLTSLEASVPLEFDDDLLIGGSSAIDQTTGQEAVLIKAQLKAETSLEVNQINTGAQVLWDLSGMIYNVHQKLSLDALAMTLPRKGTKRSIAFNTLVAYRSSNFVEKLAIRYFTARRVGDPAVRNDALTKIRTEAGNAVFVIRNLISDSLSTLAVKGYPMALQKRQYTTDMKAIKTEFSAIQDVSTSGVDTKQPENAADLAMKPLLVAAAKQASAEYSMSVIEDAAALNKRMEALSRLAGKVAKYSTATASAARLVDAVEFYNKGMIFVVTKAWISDGSKPGPNTDAYNKTRDALWTAANTLALVLVTREVDEVPSGTISKLDQALRDEINNCIRAFATSANLKTPAGFVSGGKVITAKGVSDAAPSVAQMLFDHYKTANDQAMLNYAAEVAIINNAAKLTPAKGTPDLSTPSGSPVVVATPPVGTSSAPDMPDENAKDQIRAIRKDFVRLKQEVTTHSLDPSYEDLKAELNAQRDLLDGLIKKAEDLLNNPSATATQYATVEGELRRGNIDAEAASVAISTAHRSAVMATATTATIFNDIQSTTSDLKLLMATRRKEFDALANGRGKNLVISSIADVEKTFTDADAAVAAADAIITAKVSRPVLASDLKAAGDAISNALNDFKTNYVKTFAVYDAEVEQELRQIEADAEDFLKKRAEVGKLFTDAQAALNGYEADIKALPSGGDGKLMTEAQRLLDSAKKLLVDSRAILADNNATIYQLEDIEDNWDALGPGTSVNKVGDAIEKYKASVPASAPVLTPDPAVTTPPPVVAPDAAASTTAPATPRQPPVVVNSPDTSSSTAPASSSTSKVAPIGPAGTAAAAAAAATAAPGETLLSAKDILTGTGTGAGLRGIPSDVSNFVDTTKVLVSIAANINEDSLKNIPVPKKDEGFYRAIYFYIALDKKNPKKSLAVMFVPKGYDEADTDRFTVVNSDTAYSLDRDADKRMNTRRLVKYDTSNSGLENLFPGHTVQPNTIPYKDKANDIKETGFLVVAYAPVRNTATGKRSKIVPETDLPGIFTTVGRYIYRKWREEPNPLKGGAHDFLSPAAMLEELYGIKSGQKGLSSYTGNPIDRIEPKETNEALISFKSARISSQEIASELFKLSYGGGTPAGDTEAKKTWARYAAFVMFKARTAINVDKQTNRLAGDKREEERHLPVPLDIGAPLGSGNHSDDSDWGFEDPAPNDSSSAHIQTPLPASRDEKPADAPNHWTWN